MGDEEPLTARGQTPKRLRPPCTSAPASDHVLLSMAPPQQLQSTGAAPLFQGVEATSPGTVHGALVLQACEDRTRQGFLYPDSKGPGQSLHRELHEDHGEELPEGPPP